MFSEYSNKKRIVELEERFEKLQRDYTSLKLEWADALEKITRMAGRVAKRAALAQEKEDALMGPAVEPKPDGQMPLPGILTTKQAIINAQIARRRADLANGGKA
jgi:hypothetical protein